jgi:hypothetical protein
MPAEAMRGVPMRWLRARAHTRDAAMLCCAVLPDGMLSSRRREMPTRVRIRRQRAPDPCRALHTPRFYYADCRAMRDAQHPLTRCFDEALRYRRYSPSMAPSPTPEPLTMLLPRCHAAHRKHLPRRWCANARAAAPRAPDAKDVCAA